jgi:N-acetylmuramoyl-L-alanine amidase
VAPSERDPDDEPLVVDSSALQRREARRLELARRRRVFRKKVVGALAGVAVAVASGLGLYWWLGSNGGSSDPGASNAIEAQAPVRVDIGPPSAAAAGAAVSGPATSTRRPIVWVQAGHADPREPGYRAQTGSSTGPFGSEIGFTTTIAPAIASRLRRAGVDARLTPGRVTPLAPSGAVFLSVHHDTPQGAAAFGHAISGASENYYHGEGGGNPSPLPYADSSPHRPATTVLLSVERRSRDLANRIAVRYRPIYTASNGARGRYGGVQTRSGNPRMMRYYGFYRTRAGARVLVEAGAGGVDDAFLAKTDLIATAVSRGVVDHLRSQGLLGK